MVCLIHMSACVITCVLYVCLLLLSFSYMLRLFPYHVYMYIRMCVPGVVIITTPASPLPIELVATTENV